MHNNPCFVLICIPWALITVYTWCLTSTETVHSSRAGWPILYRWLSWETLLAKNSSLIKQGEDLENGNAGMDRYGRNN